MDFPVALDIGCGTGYISTLLKKELKGVKKLYAMDSNDALIQCAKMQYKKYINKGEIEFILKDFCEDLSAFKKLHGQCSLIFSNDFFGNVKDKSVAVANLDRMAAKHADIYLMFYGPTPIKSGWIASLFNAMSPHEDFLDWKQRFKNVGLRVIDSKVIDCVEMIEDKNFETSMSFVPLI